MISWASPRTSFWAVVHGRVIAEAERAVDVEPTPGWLMTRLIFTADIPEEDVAGMTVEEALAAWHASSTTS